MVRYIDRQGLVGLAWAGNGLQNLLSPGIREWSPPKLRENVDSNLHRCGFKIKKKKILNKHQFSTSQKCSPLNSNKTNFKILLINACLQIPKQEKENTYTVHLFIRYKRQYYLPLKHTIEKMKERGCYQTTKQRPREGITK